MMNHDYLWQQLSPSARLGRRALQTTASVQGHRARAEKPQQLCRSLNHSRGSSHATCRQAGKDSQGVRIIHPLDFEATLAEMKRQ